MKPVHDLVLSTRTISELNPSKRIELSEANDELRELGETINAMLARLESAFTRTTRFTSDASHIAATLTPVAAKAQTTLKVSFSFNVGNTLVPAGTYSVERTKVPWAVFVTLENLQTNATFTWTASPGEPGPTNTRIVLKFDVIGQTHLLRSVQYHSMITSRLGRDTRINQQLELRTHEGS